MPQLQKLKRDYVVSWWRQTAARRLHMATLHSPRAPVPSAVPSAAPGGSTSPRLEYPPPPNESLLFASRAYADYPPPTSPATAGTPVFTLGANVLVRLVTIARIRRARAIPTFPSTYML